MFKKVKNKKGFTLIELIVVIAILAVLAAIIIPTVAQNIASANQARDLANARSAFATASIAVLTGTIPDGAGPAGLVAGQPCTFNVLGGLISSFSCTMPTGTYSLNTTTGVISGPTTTP